MADIVFRYSVMNAGKSLEILKIANSYRERNKNVLIFTPSIDNRYGVGKVTSRIGISEDAIPINKGTNIYIEVLEYSQMNKVSCILIDEAQFLGEHHVFELMQIADELGIPVICYGLKNDYRNHLFEGSKWLLVYADKIEEIATVCWYCDKKATMILKYENGEPVYEGEQIDIGGNEKYVSVCRAHYFEPPESNIQDEKKSKSVWSEVGTLDYIEDYAKGFLKL